MAARIAETSFGTKRATIEKIDEIIELKGRRFQWLMYRYWLRVYEYAIAECPVQTGALRASIRIHRGAIRSRSYNPGAFGVTMGFATTEERWEYYITAGGAGIINPIHKREVDYAKAVHDGWVDGRGRLHLGNPFLTRAIMRAEGEFRETVKDMLDWVEKKWSEGALKNIPPKGYFTPLRIIGGN